MVHEGVAAHDDQAMVDEHVKAIAVHEEKLSRTDTRLAQHDEKIEANNNAVITIRADIKASRYIIGAMIALSTAFLSLLKLFGGGG